jgi:seryl-tRNA synthetase
MKNIIVVLGFLLWGGHLIAQSDSGEVTQNKTKINELNERLDKLIETTGDIPKDSLEIKIDWLISEMKVVKNEISVLKSSVDAVAMDNKTILSQIENNQIDAKDLKEGMYYVVIGSRRDQKRAEELTLELAKSKDVQLVMNSKGTWNHVILKQPLKLDDAVKTVKSLRETNQFNDAWWTTSKRLQN